MNREDYRVLKDEIITEPTNTCNYFPIRHYGVILTESKLSLIISQIKIVKEKVSINKKLKSKQ